MSIKKETELAIFSHVIVTTGKDTLRYSCIRSVFQGKPTDRDEFCIDFSSARSTTWREKKDENVFNFVRIFSDESACLLLAIVKEEQRLDSFFFFFFVDDSVRVIRLC